MNNVKKVVRNGWATPYKTMANPIWRDKMSKTKLTLLVLATFLVAAPIYIVSAQCA